MGHEEKHLCLKFLQGTLDQYFDSNDLIKVRWMAEMEGWGEEVEGVAMVVFKCASCQSLLLK